MSNSLGTFLNAVDLEIEIPVTFPEGDEWDSLEGVTVEARAGLANSATVVNGAVSVSGSTITVAFDRWALAPGLWTLELLGERESRYRQIDLVARFFTITRAIKPEPA
jgi:hypothetical protein